MVIDKLFIGRVQQLLKDRRRFSTDELNKKDHRDLLCACTLALLDVKKASTNCKVLHLLL